MNLFGRSKFYRKNLKWTNEFVRKNINIIEHNYSLNPYKNKWNCNVHSVHDYETSNVYRINYEFLRREYEKVSVEATRKFGIKSFRLGDIWYNYYKKGQYQEPHVHDGVSGLTAVHYLIFDPRYHSYTNFSDTNVKSPKIRGGDIVFFSNTLEHYVPENETDKPRLTIAFTVTRLH